MISYWNKKENKTIHNLFGLVLTQKGQITCIDNVEKGQKCH